MSLNLSRLHPTLKIIARNLPKVARGLGFDVRITSGWRSYQTQAKLYNDYIRGVSHYPANPPGQSKHEQGLAIDVISTNTESLVALLTSVGLVWAGPGDPIHFQIGYDKLKRGPVGGPRTNDLPRVNTKGRTFLKNAAFGVSVVDVYKAVKKGLGF